MNTLHAPTTNTIAKYIYLAMTAIPVVNKMNSKINNTQKKLPSSNGLLSNSKIMKEFLVKSILS